MIKYLLAFLSAIFLSIALGKITIPLLKRLKAGQTILVYVSEHESKNGTPTMGGLFFIFSIILAFVFFGGLKSNIARVCLVITCAFMFVGFMDDFIKIRSKNNEGLKPYQKIIFQVLIGVIAGIYAYKTGIDFIYIPFIKTTFNLGLFTIPLLAVVFIAITNSVNLTDGLDGLSGSVTVAYLLGFIAVVFAQSFYYGESYFFIQEFDGLMLLSITSIGAILGFLTFNVFRAKVFMGDTGSLALGGLIGSLSIFSANTLLIPFIGIAFVISSLSVIIQVFYYKLTKKRVFLMAPYHHHLIRKGLTENKIAYIYTLLTIIFSVIILIGYLVF